MKILLAILIAGLVAPHAYAESEPEGREGLKLICMKTAGNSETFCRCLADTAVDELTARVRQELSVEWIPPSIFNFERAMTGDEPPESLERTWGPFQRRAVVACRAAKSN
jgi:hypothetical protein